MAEQRELPFAEAEGTLAERRQLLGMALGHIGCDTKLSVFAQWVFNTTAGGTTAELVKSYEELARRPWGLCCSKSQARATVAQARQFGLVLIFENRYASHGQKANGYAIDWDGVRCLLGLRSRAEGHAPHEPGAHGQHGGACGQHGGAVGEHPYKEILSLNPLCNSGPDRKAGPPEMEAGPEGRGSSGGVSGGVAVSPPSVLAEARSRTVEPLPAGALKHGIFKAITESNLREPDRLLTWFRRQLSADRPATENTEADLLLVLAAARYALALPRASVRRSRVGVFIDIVAHGRVERAFPWLDEAQAWLDTELERYGREGLLEGSVWPPKELEKSDLET